MPSRALLIHCCFNLFSCTLFSATTATYPDIFSTKDKPLFLLPRENDPSPVLGIFKLGCISVILFKFGTAALTRLCAPLAHCDRPRAAYDPTCSAEQPRHGTTRGFDVVFLGGRLRAGYDVDGLPLRPATAISVCGEDVAYHLELRTRDDLVGGAM
ncbi:hypothetical protein PIB30_075084 [Stylosanthes scabra]|uniref:Uncharacterized protein n=1 Tax=Stylosanthes scabra TaxID=79078 RepID=A0ABU6WTA6_9FABA|nr:hypothetical protein [Stylosanthes scabra]